MAAPEQSRAKRGWWSHQRKHQTNMQGHGLCTVLASRPAEVENLGCYTIYSDMIHTGDEKWMFELVAMPIYTPGT